MAHAGERCRQEEPEETYQSHEDAPALVQVDVLATVIVVVTLKPRRDASEGDSSSVEAHEQSVDEESDPTIFKTVHH